MDKEKKEIWILIELLNEYSKEIWYFNEEDLQWQTKAWILSKEFWFIKWLVENDKIDIWQKLFNLTKNDNRKSIICDLDNNDFSWEDTFLMLLSISDTPIEDLISYLK